MRVAVYLPLLVPVFAWMAHPLARRLAPRLATWLLTVAAAVLATTSSAALGCLTLAGAAQIPFVATLGDWSPEAIRRTEPAALPVTVTATVLLAAAVVTTVRVLWSRMRALRAAAQEAAQLPGTGELVIVEDPAAEAFALPGRPGRIVVSTGMLAALDPAERDVLVAHERAHLTGRHFLFVVMTSLAVAANPFLRPLASAAAYTIERWADESAVAACGDRHRAAVAVGKAALAARHPTASGRRAVALGAAAGREDTAGPIPRRVAALLAPPQRSRLLPLVLVVVVLTVTGLAVLEAARDLDVLLDLAELR